MPLPLPSPGWTDQEHLPVWILSPTHRVLPEVHVHAATLDVRATDPAPRGPLTAASLGEGAWPSLRPEADAGGPSRLHCRDGWDGCLSSGLVRDDAVTTLHLEHGAGLPHLTPLHLLAFPSSLPPPRPPPPLPPPSPSYPLPPPTSPPLPPFPLSSPSLLPSPLLSPPLLSSLLPFQPPFSPPAFPSVPPLSPPSLPFLPPLLSPSPSSPPLSPSPFPLPFSPSPPVLPPPLPPSSLTPPPFPPLPLSPPPPPSLPSSPPLPPLPLLPHVPEEGLEQASSQVCSSCPVSAW